MSFVLLRGISGVAQAVGSVKNLQLKESPIWKYSMTTNDAKKPDPLGVVRISGRSLLSSKKYLQ